MRKIVVKTRIIIIGTATLITGLAWFGFEIYHKIVTNEITPDVAAQLTPLDPKLDVQVLEELSGKRALDVNFPQSLPPLDQSTSINSSP